MVDQQETGNHMGMTVLRSRNIFDEGIFGPGFEFGGCIEGLHLDLSLGII